MKATIRRATAADLPALGLLWEEFMDYHRDIDPNYARVDDATERWFSFIEPKFDDEDWRFLVAECDSGLVGFVCAMIREHPPVFRSTRHGYIESIAVAGAHRRQGIGRRLMREAELWLRSKGITEINANIDARNPKSLGLFNSRGFDPWLVVKRKIIEQ